MACLEAESPLADGATQRITDIITTEPKTAELYEAFPVGLGIGSVRNKGWELLDSVGDALRS